MFAVLIKEIRVMLRSRKAFWFLLLALLAVGGVFCLGWVNVASVGPQLGARTRIARMLFMIFSMVQLCAMGLIAPLMTASTMTVERESKTMDLLISTGLSRLKLLLGKWFATIYYELMLLLCLLPVLSLVFQLGGIGLDEYLFAALMIAVTVLTYGMVGMACSCIFRKSVTALFVTLLVILFLSGGLAILLAVLAEWHWITWSSLEPDRSANMYLRFLFWSVSPVLTWAEHVANLERAGINRPGQAMPYFSAIFIGHLVFQAVLFLVALKVAHRAILRRETEKNVRAAHQIDNPAVLARRRKKFPYYLIDPLRRPQVIPDGLNPVIVKEQRVGALARPQVLFRMSYLCLPLSLFLVPSAAKLEDFDYVFHSAAFALTLIMLFIPIFAASMISREREEKTIDLLATTTLTSSQIVNAKFRVVMRFAGVITANLMVWPLALRAFKCADWFSGSLPAWEILTSLFWHCGVMTAIAVCLIASFSAVYASLCIYYSSTQRRNVGAIVICYIIFGLFCVSPMIGALYFELADDPWGYAAFLKPPLYMLFKGIAPLFSHVYYLGLDTFRSSYEHWYVFWKTPSGLFEWKVGMLHGRPVYLNPLPILLHAALVLGTSMGLLRLAARRLRKEMR